MLIALLVIVFLKSASCQNTSYQQDPGWRAPAGAAARPNPLASRPEAVAGGEKLFRRNCVECHGENGAGIAKKNSADLRLSIVQQQSMPSFSRLPELQRWQLVLYLRKLKAVPDARP
jgi:mono/diheme cytochrome c family protein